MSNQQFIVVGKSDSDSQAPLCLLTRRVFTSYDDAAAFVNDPSPGRHRGGQVVQCYFTVPASLYADEWSPKSELSVQHTNDSDELKTLTDALLVWCERNPEFYFSKHGYLARVADRIPLGTVDEQHLVPMEILDTYDRWMELDIDRQMTTLAH